jgi:hypothetical protein
VFVVERLKSIRKIQVLTCAVRYSSDVHMRPLLQRALVAGVVDCAAQGSAHTQSAGSGSTSSRAVKKLKT